MPLYEFECLECQHPFEELVSATQTVLPVCPNCSSPRVRKKVSAGAIRAGGMSAGSAGFSAPSCAPSGG